MLGIGSGAGKSGKIRRIVKDGLQAWYKADVTQAPLGEEEIANGSFLTGPELVSNGNFSNGITGWFNYDQDSTSNPGLATVTNQGGYLRLANATTGTNTDWRKKFVEQAITWESGKTYQIKARVRASENGMAFHVRSKNDASGDNNIAENQSLTTDFQEFIFYYTAASDSVDISFGVLAWHQVENSQYIEIDDVSVKRTNPNDSWAISNGSGNNSEVTIKDGSVLIDYNSTDNQNTGISIGGIITLNKKYKVEIVVDSLSVDNKLKVHTGNDNNTLSVGVNTFEMMSTSNNTFSIARTEDATSVTATVSKVSLKEITNSVRDYSSNKNNAVLYSGTALDFDGAEDDPDYVTTDYPAAGTTVDSNFKCTVALWFNAATLGSRMIFGCGQTSPANNRFYLWTSGNKLYFNYGDQNSTPTTGAAPTIVADRWYRAVIVADGLTAYVYLDGELQYTRVSTFNPTTLTANLTIGRHGAESNFEYDGMVSDFQVYDACWTASDVTYDWDNPDKDVFDDKDRVAMVIGDELNTIENPTSVTNESSNIPTSTDGTTGFTHSKITLDSSVTSNSNHSIKFQSTGNGDRTYMDLDSILTAGKLYKLQIDSRHSGSGDDFILQFNTTSSLNTGSAQTAIADITSSDTNFTTYTQIFTHSDKTRFFGIKEDGSNNNAAGYLDNLTIKEYQSTGIQPTDCKTLLRLNEGAGIRLYDAAPVLSKELIYNNDFSNGTTGWEPEDIGATIEVGTFKGRENVAKINTLGTDNNDRIRQDFDRGTYAINGDGFKRDTLYSVEVDVFVESGDFRFDTPNGDISDNFITTTNTGSWETIKAVVMSESTAGAADPAGYVWLRSVNSVAEFYVDKVSFKEITLNDSFAYVDGSNNTTEWKTAQPYIPQYAMSSYSKKAIFDGTDDNVNCGSDTTIDNIFTDGGTWSCWISPNNFGEASNPDIIVKGNVRIRVASDSGNPVIRFLKSFSGNNGNWKTPAITFSKLTHVAVAYNSNSNGHNPDIYVNGIKQTVTKFIPDGETEAPTGSATSDASSDLFIGGAAGGGNNYEGFVDEVSIFNKKLTESEVQEIFNSGTALDVRDHSAYSDVVAYWRNNGVDTWTDLSTNSNNGTVDGSPTTIQLQKVPYFDKDSLGLPMNKIREGGLNLNGDGYLKIDDSSDFDFGTTGFTIQAWVKPFSLTANDRIITKGKTDAAEWMISVGSDNASVRVYAEDSGNASLDSGNNFSTLSLNTWAMITVVIDTQNDQILFYKDDGSVETYSTGTWSGNFNGAAPLIIGANEALDADRFDGIIDDVKIYNKVLTAAEKTKNYKKGLATHK